MKNVLVIGSTCVDVIIRVDHLPRTEENIHPDSQRFAVGGCAYNVANILGRAGAEMTFVTPVGRQGVFGGFVRSHLEALGFDYVDLPDAQNGCCYCFVERNGERTFVSVHGAEYTFDPEWMKRYTEEKFDYAYVCGLEIEEKTGERLVEYLESAQAQIGTIVYAPGPRGMRIKKELTDRLFALKPILHLNESEAKALAGIDDLDNALHRLYRRTGNAVVATRGAQGVRWNEADELFSAEGVLAEHIVDTIGAGDAHCGAMLLGLCRDMSLKESLELANRVSSEVVQTDGATLPDEMLLKLVAPRE